MFKITLKTHFFRYLRRRFRIFDFERHHVVPPVRHVTAETTHALLAVVSLEGTKAASLAPAFDTRLVRRINLEI